MSRPPAYSLSGLPNLIPGDRLRLREYTDEQVARLLDESARDPEYADDYPFDGSRGAATGYARRRPEDHAPGFGMYAVIRNADDRIIGDIGFHTAPHDGSAEIGFGLAPSARGQGYGTEMVGLLTGWATRQPRLARLTARVLPTNAASLKVLAHNGFHETGEEQQGHLVLRRAR